MGTSQSRCGLSSKSALLTNQVPLAAAGPQHYRQPVGKADILAHVVDSAVALSCTYGGRLGLRGFDKPLLRFRVEVDRCTTFRMSGPVLDMAKARSDEECIGMYYPSGSPRKMARSIASENKTIRVYLARGLCSARASVKRGPALSDP